VAASSVQPGDAPVDGLAAGRGDNIGGIINLQVKLLLYTCILQLHCLTEKQREVIISVCIFIFICLKIILKNQIMAFISTII